LLTSAEHHAAYWLVWCSFIRREGINESAQRNASNRRTNNSALGDPQSVEQEILEVKETKQWQKNLIDAIQSTKPLLIHPHGKWSTPMPLWTATPVANSLVDLFLSSLKFTEMRDHQERIAEAHSKTFEWIFRSPPRRWNLFILSRDFSLPWRWEELQQAFRILLEESTTAVKYVFFIDGLDEFNGDLFKLISLMKWIFSFSNVKVCVSSRPGMFSTTPSN
jgi:hypothetical protein